MPDELLTVKDVAELLTLNQQTIRNMIDRGEMGHVRVGQRRVRVRQSQLDAFLAAGESSAQLAEANPWQAVTKPQALSSRPGRRRIAMPSTGRSRRWRTPLETSRREAAAAKVAGRLLVFRSTQPSLDRRLLSRLSDTAVRAPAPPLLLCCLQIRSARLAPSGASSGTEW